MDNKEILQRVNSQPKIDEREKGLFQKANLIAVIIMSIFVVAFVMVTGALQMRPAYFSLLASLFSYCAALYLSRYILFEKKVGVLIAGIAYTISCLAMLVLFIIAIVLGW